MNLRFDKVIRSVGFGFHKVYSLVLDDDGLYLIRTGGAGALRHYTRRADGQIVSRAPTDRGVKEIEQNEARLNALPLPELLAADRECYRVRLEAIEEVIVEDGPPPQMAIKVTGSDHFLKFPYATLAEVQTLQRALDKWGFKN